jgi:hypothetical protein
MTLRILQSVFRCASIIAIAAGGPVVLMEKRAQDDESNGQSCATNNSESWRRNFPLEHGSQHIADRDIARMA